MRRRKGNRGRPRKVKKGRITRLTESLNLESKVSEDNPSDQTLSLKSDDAVNGDFIGLDKTGPYSYRVGSVNIELESSEEDIKPEILENDIVLEVECGSNTAKMHLSRLCQGSKGSCILFDGAWLTPNEFQFVSGRETAKDWKRSIRHFGRSLKLLITKGILTVHPAACRCDSCRLLTSSTNEPKVVREKRQRDQRERANRGSEGSASGSDKEDVSRGSEEDEASEEADADSRGSGENGVDESGSSSDEEGEEEEEEGGNVEENNNVAEEKAESSSASGSSTSSSDSSDSESESEEEKDKEEEEEVVEEEEEEEDEEEEEKTEDKEEETEQNTEVSTEPAESASLEAEVEETDKMDVDEEEKEEEEEEEEEIEESKEQKEEDEEGEVDSVQKVEDNVVEDDAQQETEVEPECVDEEEDAPEPPNVQGSIENEDESEEVPMDIENSVEKDVENDDVISETNQQEDPEMKVSPKPEETPEVIADMQETGESEELPTDVTEELCEEPKVEQEESKPEVEPSVEFADPSEVPAEELPPSDRKPVLDTVEESCASSVDDSETNSSRVDTNADTPPSTREQSPAPPKSSTPTLTEVPPRKSVERSNSSGGKSRLSNIIDLLRTSKEKETQKQPVLEKQEERPPERRKPDVNEIRQIKEVREVKDTKVPSPLPPKREEPKPRRLEKEQQIPKLSKDEAKLNQNVHEAMRYPMGHLPFGFPPPELLERASREAHEQLSKSHRQFEKNLESLIAQNMNPFIPELSIFSLPEHRAQMEYNYLKNMERLDQMAKERMMTMAEMRHQQLLQEHNSFVAKLAEQQKAALKAEERNNREVPKRSVPPVKKPQKDQSPSHTKVPHAHRAMPEVRKEKPDHRTLQSPPAAHHHHPASRPPSTGSKPPSSLPLPASSSSNSRAAYPTGSSSLQSRSSPMIAPIAPPLQMWSSCFPYVIPPPNMEMQRLTQFFPNLNGGLFSPETGARRNTESPILDLSTKKRKMDYKDDESRSKHAKMSSSFKSVSASQSNGLSREQPRSSSHPSNEAFSAKTKSAWSNAERNSVLKCTCALQHLNDIRNWSVDDVSCFLKGLEGCTIYADTFRRNGIDGSTLMLLTTDFLTKSLGMRQGSAKFLTDSVARRARDLQKLVPCDYCRIKNQKG